MTTSMQAAHIDVRWMTEATWFVSDDAALVRAGVLLLEAASRSTVPATLPADPAILARLSGFGANVWAEKGLLALEGFEQVEGGGWRHVAMADLVAAVNERFGAQLQELAASSVLASKAVDEFPLIGEIKPAGRSKGLKALPKDYTFSDKLLEEADRAGYITQEHQQWLLTKFQDFASSKTRLYKNWDAAARNYFTSAITAKDFHTAFGYWPRESRQRMDLALSGTPTPVRSGPQTFEGAALRNSTDTMAKVLAARFGKRDDVQDVQDVQDVKPRPATTGSRPMGFGFGFGAAGGAA